MTICQMADFKQTAAKVTQHKREKPRERDKKMWKTERRDEISALQRQTKQEKFINRFNFNNNDKQGLKNTVKKYRVILYKIFTQVGLK